ncbi:hypothetical protein LQG66_21925 [Bradyrhizobium ontarionense]|uniref:Uncharacterized protein n=1 Tax=Bradyrhizobium ontarionense TaxID=2898149 RepID=A0ABY3R4I1_9BRAD|nr:hypothetical protein [Bradyrhizobium sp. A19]UFZ01967.1 hypothetical protein LQG66_21925 [Bradyrhizobium sp. A19]
MTESLGRSFARRDWSSGKSNRCVCAIADDHRGDLLSLSREIRRGEKLISPAASVRSANPDLPRLKIPFAFPEFVLFFCHPASPRGAFRDRHETRGGDAVAARCRSMSFNGMRTNDALADVKLRGPGAPMLALTSRGMLAHRAEDGG